MISEAVAQPLDQRAGDRDRALEHVGRLVVAELVADRGQQAVGADDLLAGVDEQERAGAVGVLGVAGLEAGLAEQRRLLVAEDARQRAAADRAVPRRPRSARSRTRSPAASRGTPIEVERGLVAQSSVSRSISSVRLALVTSVTWMPPSLPPVRFHSTQVSMVPNSSSPFSALARAVDVVEDPRDLGGRRSRWRAGPVTSRRRSTPSVAGELADEPAGARVLPHDRVVDRLAGLAVPDDRGLALVGDADRLDVAGLGVGVGHRAVDDLARAAPDLGRVVLDPAGLRVDLLVLALIDVGDAAVLVEEDEARAGGALVDRADVLAHAAAPPGSSMAVSAPSSISGSGSAPRAISTSRTSSHTRRRPARRRSSGRRSGPPCGQGHADAPAR